MSHTANKDVRGLYLKWGLAGMGLAGPLFFISAISHRFANGVGYINKPIISVVALMIMAGAVYLVVIFGFRSTVFKKGLILWVIFLGLLIRLGMFSSTPILEDDYFRYMWDGAILANGFNPYRYAPQEILDERNLYVPHKLRQLAIESGSILRKINYPHLRTIYPPIAQIAFAVAHIIHPWALWAWRLLLLLVDLVTLYLLFITLRRLNLPLMGLVIYWWNPLLIKEI